MRRVQFSLARLMIGVALTALACFATRFTWNCARWLLLPSLAVFLIAAWSWLLASGRQHLVLAGLVLGGVAGWLLEMFALVLADAGQGTYLPLVAFFAPILMPELLAPSSVPDMVSTTLLAVAPLLFSGYGAAVAGATGYRWGPGCFAAVVLFHHSMVAIAFSFSPASDMDLAFQKAFSLRPGWVIAATISFVVIHLATLAFLIGNQTSASGKNRG